MSLSRIRDGLCSKGRVRALCSPIYSRHNHDRFGLCTMDFPVHGARYGVKARCVTQAHMGSLWTWLKSYMTCDWGPSCACANPRTGRKRSGGEWWLLQGIRAGCSPHLLTLCSGLKEKQGNLAGVRKRFVKIRQDRLRMCPGSSAHCPAECG